MFAYDSLCLPFASQGRAEPIRLALAIGDIEFEDYRIEWDKWPSIKDTMPFGIVPILEVNGEKLAQSNAILRYIGKLTGLYPTDALEAFRVDEFVDTISEVMEQAFLYNGPDKDVLRETRQKFCDNIPRYVGTLDKMVKESGKGPFFLGEKVTIADLKVQQAFVMISSDFLEFVDTNVFDEYTTLKAISQAVNDLPPVRQWVADHKSYAGGNAHWPQYHLEIPIPKYSSQVNHNRIIQNKK